MSVTRSSLAGNGSNGAAAAGRAAPPDLRQLLRGRYVTCTGRLAWLSHEQFEDVVESLGGRFTHGLGAGVAALVVGERDLPLNRDGTLAKHLCLARVMERARTLGATILSESQFLRGLGLGGYVSGGEGGDEGPRLYTTATLTDLLEIPPARIRAWVRAGLVRPVKTEHGVWHFDFRQVAAVKTLDHLMRSGVHPSRIRRSLDQLRRWLPEAQQSLDQLSLLEHNGDLLVRLEHGDLATADGQLHFDYSGEAAEDASAPLRLHVEVAPTTPGAWFEQGVEQQRAGYLAESAESYRQALQLGGPDAQVCFDLANVLRELGQKRQAMERYLQAVEVDRNFADAWNNLGILLCEMGRREAACTAFRRAIAANPADARAHYNLADVLDELRLTAEACEYWRQYLRFDASSERAEYARQRLTAS
jgi:tetratricopeptide (TPR) repeat protein